MKHYPKHKTSITPPLGSELANRLAHLERGITAYRNLDRFLLNHQPDEPAYSGELWRIRHEITQWEIVNKNWVDHGPDGVTCNAVSPDNLRCNRIVGHSGDHHAKQGDWANAADEKDAMERRINFVCRS
jgi:hypothetical protein